MFAIGIIRVAHRLSWRRPPNAQATDERDQARKAEATATSERNRTVAAEAQVEQRRDRAVIEKNRADEQAATVRAVNDFLQDDLPAQASARIQSSPKNKPDPDLTTYRAGSRRRTDSGQTRSVTRRGGFDPPDHRERVPGPGRVWGGATPT